MALNPINVLPHVKARLNRLAGDTTLDSYLTSRIAAASSEMKRSGIRLDDTQADDLMLCADYVVWQYQNRDTGGAMPDWLRLRRRERWLAQQPPVQETDGGSV